MFYGNSVDTHGRYREHKRRDSKSAGYTGGPVNIQAVSFPGDTVEESIFQVGLEESLKKFTIVDGGI